MKFQVEIEISDEAMSDIITTVNYGGGAICIKRPRYLGDVSFTVYEDVEDNGFREGTEEHEVQASHLAQIIARVAVQDWFDGHDYEMADMVFQEAALGEVRYG